MKNREDHFLLLFRACRYSCRVPCRISVHVTPESSASSKPARCAQVRLVLCKAQGSKNTAPLCACTGTLRIFSRDAPAHSVRKIVRKRDEEGGDRRQNCNELSLSRFDLAHHNNGQSPSGNRGDGQAGPAVPLAASDFVQAAMLLAVKLKRSKEAATGKKARH